MGNFDAIKRADIRIEDVHRKYIAGSLTDDYEDIKKLKPVFSFDFASMKQTELCFDGNDLGVKDYKKLIKALKTISRHTYETLNNNYQFHFHSVTWEDTSISSSLFHKRIGVSEEESENIDAYQFKLFQEARLFGFLYMGVFYVVLFDRGHSVYDGKRHGKRR